MQEQVQVTFTGPSMSNVAGQAAAFGKLASANVGSTGAVASGASTAKPKAKKAPPAEDTESLLGAGEDDSESLSHEADLALGEDMTGDETEDGDESAFDSIADEPANSKATPAKNKAQAEAKTAKGPKVTLKEVNAALLGYMKLTKKSKAQVQALLLKNFKVETVNELKESDYAKVIAAVTKN